MREADVRPVEQAAQAGKVHSGRGRGEGRRRQRLLAPLALAAETGVPARTCAKIAARRGMPRLADIDRVTGETRRRGPVTPVRHERTRPGELVHADVKKVARIPDGGGWRARGGPVLAHPNSAKPATPTSTWRWTTSPASPTPSSCSTSAGARSAFMGRCIGFFTSLGVSVERVMTDNGPSHRSGEFNSLLASSSGSNM